MKARTGRHTKDEALLISMPWAALRRKQMRHRKHSARAILSKPFNARGKGWSGRARPWRAGPETKQLRICGHAKWRRLRGAAGREVGRRHAGPARNDSSGGRVVKWRLQR